MLSPTFTEKFVKYIENAKRVGYEFHNVLDVEICIGEGNLFFIEKVKDNLYLINDFDNDMKAIDNEEYLEIKQALLNK